jgi:hypothetical protein
MGKGTMTGQAKILAVDDEPDFEVLLKQRFRRQIPHSSLMTGSMPGIAASTSETWLLGSPPNAVEAPENSFEFEVTWAWISMPITTSQSPVEPLISLWEVAGAFMGAVFRIWDIW